MRGVTMAGEGMRRQAPERGSGESRRPLLRTAAVLLVVSLLHFADHVIRGGLVVERGLPAAWNHSGWPFRPEVTPFTYSLMAVLLLLGGGIVGTAQGRLRSGYWLATAVALFALVTFVHFVSPQAETPAVIIGTYGSGPAPILALIVLVGILLGLAVLAWAAFRARRATGHW